MEAQTEVVPQENLLLTLEKSEKDQIRVRETVFKDKEYIDIRFFNKGRKGDFLPTKKGITLTRDKMKELVKALAKAKL